ncbi:hypothetical protein LTR28_004488, partial [Elasticomyces elasticus]
MSSDSGSAQNFREMEDGYAFEDAFYDGRKDADETVQLCRIRSVQSGAQPDAPELKRKDDDTIILAMHPGEVSTDMANIEVGWEVEGIITAQESVSAMIK